MMKHFSILVILFLPAFLISRQDFYDSLGKIFEKQIRENNNDTLVAIAWLSLAKLKENIHANSAIQVYLQGADCGTASFF